MNIQDELQSLVKIYAVFNSEMQRYIAQLDKASLLELDKNLFRVFNKLLLEIGPATEEIREHYKILVKYVHPDHRELFIPEVLWLEDVLSEGRNDGICFKTLHTCYERLTDPQKFKDIRFTDINNKEDCRAWLEQLKNKATTYSGRSFCESLIGLLDRANSYFDEVGKIKPKGVKALLKFAPMVLASYGAFIVAEEFFAIYALYFVLLKGGQYLYRNDSNELRRLGTTMQNISGITALATTTLLVRLLEMTFWFSQHCLQVSLQIGSILAKPAEVEATASTEVNQEPDLCRDLVLASQITSRGIVFDTPELKLVSAPLEAYIELNKEQYFRVFRVGELKNRAVKRFLTNLQVFDQLPSPLETKLIQAQKELKVLLEDDQVYKTGIKTKKAVDTTKDILDSLLGDLPSSVPQIEYHPNHSLLAEMASSVPEIEYHTTHFQTEP